MADGRKLDGLNLEFSYMGKRAVYQVVAMTLIRVGLGDLGGDT